MVCPACAHDNPEDARFCNSCGQPLGDAGGQRPDVPNHLAEKIRAGKGALEGERKQVTVLFADVMGSMELAEQTDAETWQKIMDRFFAILSDGIHRFEGTVDKFTGDGIMALFGAPVAHEDHARRSCFAAMHLLDQLAEYGAELRRKHGLSFSVRLGLNSGEVVVGSIGENLEMSYTAVGHTVGLAQRMEQLAEPGKAYVTEDTAALAEGYVDMRDLGEFDVKGSSQPMRVFELVGAGSGRGRLDVSRSRGFSRFVGRNAEIATLEDALEASRKGDGRVVGVVGEPGVGKSRLCHEFAEHCRANGIPVYEAQAQAHGKAVPLLPVLQLLRAYYAITPEDNDRRAREKVAGRLLLLDPGFAEDLPLLFDFMAIPDPERPAPHMDPEARMRRLLDIGQRIIRVSSEQEPGINVLEDLHWIDPGSEVFLESLISAVAGSHTLSICNFRPEYEAEWMNSEHYIRIPLEPLGDDAIDELLDDLLGHDSSLVELRAIVRDRTAGNPFFIEEVVQTLVESGKLEGDRGAYRLTGPIDEAIVPASVQAVLAARIDRLGDTEKLLLQNASVIGKEFSRPVLSAVSDLEDADMDAALAGLLDAEFIYEEAAYPEALYAFKHPLTQEVAQGSLLSDRRVRVHAAVAEAIPQIYPERADEQSALVAQHWEQAEEDLQAARWHARSAAWSGTRDPAASLAHWRRVSELASGLPEDAETAALGTTSRIWTLQFGWRLGMTMEEADRLFREADELAQRHSDMRSRASLLTVYASVRGLAGEITVDEYAQAALEGISLAEESGDKALYVGISIAPAFALGNAGRFGEALEIAEKAIEYGKDDPTIGTGISVACPYAWCLMWKGVQHLYLGDLDEGEHWIDRGLDVAREQDDMETAGWCYEMRTWADWNRGVSERAVADGTQQFEIAERIGDSFSRTWSRHWLGLAHRMVGEWDRAIELIEESERMSAEHRTAILGRGPRLTMLAECYLEKGQTDRAEAAAREGVKVMEAQCQRWLHSYACNVLARVLSRGPGADSREEIDALLDRAERSAREMGYKAAVAETLRERAEIAGRFGDREAYESGLREAISEFEAIGASGHVDKLSQLLELQPS